MLETLMTSRALATGVLEEMVRLAMPVVRLSSVGPPSGINDAVWVASTPYT